MENSTPSKSPDWHFEQGPIRPPSEARSLLLRISRNCPWNRCTFCPVYKGQKFSLRSVEDVCADIDAVARHLQVLRRQCQEGGYASQGVWQLLHDRLPTQEQAPFRAAAHWLSGGLQSVFLQDADGLITGPARLTAILHHLRSTFPWPFRITAYTRSKTVLRFQVEELVALRKAGLTRLHIGLESGCDEVLEKVCKGATRDIHIRAGRRIRQAELELSEYFMPGLGGRALSERHARDSASALSAINPDFIRLRTLAIPEGIPLHDDWRSGRFQLCSSLEIALELLVFLENLDGFTGKLASDHALNLFEDLNGTLPDDIPRLVGMLREFIDLPDERRCLYLIGRRGGVLRGLQDLQDSGRESAAAALCEELGATVDNVEEICRLLLQRFI
ncbi:radical SAM domain iron-sulfur cluster-binding oxidoreductase [Syntrophotalea carbinolica DSM 2380]|uniref:Radical SAM domain iron-sulfur cluster-binding oxidoreductase n=1 Tax=Syntrophotalea carbinolica (strain DSM 2380 / NBRC 103641 / GraBd1) TaxID=338963 RepID=Q3A073_SYNC1|nr:radical SAM protein [Syntrophotalea carbinolica]ABA90234.1 radical SAM domain iron-sulfur cluster-binding oxidoreductase [Syntrophotalea carbinolica DSM 2380]